LSNLLANCRIKSHLKEYGGSFVAAALSLLEMPNLVLESVNAKDCRIRDA
jgi:hypothetical protein